MSRDADFDARQYAMLMYCSYKGDTIFWNKWRLSHPDEEINLKKADLRKANLKEADLGRANLQKANLFKANLQEADLFYANLQEVNLREANLKEANLLYANLQEADLEKANLQEADLGGTNLQKANLFIANLQEADLIDANLQKSKLLQANLQLANLIEANLQKADFRRANLQGANLFDANLQGADLSEANLQATNLKEANLEDADFTFSIVDGETIINKCKISKETDFTGFGLESARIEPKLKEGLKNIIRKKQWQKWFDEDRRWWSKILKYIFAWPFWLMSDYGRSTLRIAICFFVLSFMFVGVYYTFGLYDYYQNDVAYNPGIINDLFPCEFNPNLIHLLKIFVRSLYFSIVTMTTLGFGDMHANSESWFGHILLVFQVLMGYVMLGALVTRFAILFSGVGPAQKPEKIRKDQKK